VLSEATFFQISDIPRILPEILLLVLAILVLGSDIFERWASDEKAQLERKKAAGSLTLTGLALIFFITLVQSGYLYRVPEGAADNFFFTILRNLQGGGMFGEPVVGAFATDNLTMVGRLLFIGAAFLAVLLTLDYRPDNNPGEFYALILFSTTGMCLMSAASELIIAYLAVELTSIPLYILAGYFQKDTRVSSEAGMKYFLFGALSSGILLYGLSLVYGFTAFAAEGTAQANVLTQFRVIAQLTGDANTGILTLGMLFIIAGIGYKVAVVPFHSWSPDVYQGAPTTMTAFISTASKGAGFVLMYRFLASVFPGLTGSAAPGPEFGGWTSVLAILALVTVIVGNLAALPQTNAKRLLAYSSVAHAGFILMALIAWALPQSVSPETMDPATYQSLMVSYRTIGTSSLLYYLVVYTVTNIGAFGALAAISMALGGDDIEDLNGLAQRNLGLAVLFTICVLSLAGIPPLSGFFAKFYVFMAAWQSDAWWLVITALLTTIISLYYYLRLLKAMFINAPSSRKPVAVPRAMNAAIVLSTLLVMLLGIYPNLVLTTINQVRVAAGL
jgi:NADH-quinone oxidoreductase subunit N